MTDTTKTNRICKCVDLAVGAKRIDSEAEMYAAANRAGAMAKAADISLQRMWDELPECREGGVWDGVVDGWYGLTTV